jgi:hypothetical protein
MTSTETNVTALAVRPVRQETALAPVAAFVPMAWSEIVQMCEQLVRTGFLPDAIKTGAQAAAIVLAGQEMGIPPMRSMRTLYIYKGKIDEYADSQLARFKAKGGRSKFVELTATRAVLWLRHPNGDEHTETFTMDDAKAAGLSGSNSNYAKVPKSMLRSRAITNGLKSLGWEDAIGSYDPSEIDSFAHAPVPHPARTTTVTVDDAEISAPVKITPSKYRADAARKARIGELLDACGITEGRQEYIAEAAGGGFPESDDECDALISELEARAAEYQRHIKSEPGQDG